MKNCPVCGYGNKDDAVFCEKCKTFISSDNEENRDDVYTVCEEDRPYLSSLHACDTYTNRPIVPGDKICICDSCGKITGADNWKLFEGCICGSTTARKIGSLKELATSTAVPPQNVTPPQNATPLQNITPPPQVAYTPPQRTDTPPAGNTPVPPPQTSRNTRRTNRRPVNYSLILICLGALAALIFYFGVDRTANRKKKIDEINAIRYRYHTEETEAGSAWLEPETTDEEIEASLSDSVSSFSVTGDPVRISAVSMPDSVEDDNAASAGALCDGESSTVWVGSSNALEERVVLHYEETEITEVMIRNGHSAGLYKQYSRICEVEIVINDTTFRCEFPDAYKDEYIIPVPAKLEGKESCKAEVMVKSVYGGNNEHLAIRDVCLYSR